MKKIIISLSFLLALALAYALGSFIAVNKLNSIPDLNKFDWSRTTKEEARRTLGKHIDAAEVPYGDLAIPSDVVHSRRYTISQWQRAAAGAIVIVLSKNYKGDLALALGVQRGTLHPPQGYMEVPMPREDLTGLREKGASRLNGATGELIKADDTIEDNAVREVKEELNLDIDKKQLALIGVSLQNENTIVPVIAAQYTVMLDTTPPLKVIDEEFASYDLRSPKWFKIKDIVCKVSDCYVDGQTIAIDRMHVPIIQKAIKRFSNELQLDKYKNFLDFKSPIKD